MYLKKIELHGFKSFADKVNIEFQPGITGIVGPNGCGKSNISDAVRWVLGEQSVKSLRGSNMADVIFAGSQDRRAQNLAEVTLIFDNSDRMLNYDYNEVEITRRLYRQGNEAGISFKSATMSFKRYYRSAFRYGTWKRFAFYYFSRKYF